jgi:hypothetical protein
MKMNRKYLHKAIVAALITAMLLSACSLRLPALRAPTPTATPVPTSTPAPTATPLPLPTSPALAGDVIPLKPLSDLTSLTATVTIAANGTFNGEPAQGDLVAELTTNDQKMSQVVVTGSLLGDIIAQVGGAAVSLFQPSQLTIYKVPEGTYAVVKGLFEVCVKLKDLNATSGLDDLSPQSLMTMLTSSDVARGKLVGEGTLNGMAVKHYVIDGKSFLAAAQQSADPKVRSFGESLKSAKDADLYVSSEGGYPVAFRGGYSGALDPLKFEGDYTVQIELTGINTNPPVSLPRSCDNPISQ